MIAFKLAFRNLIGGGLRTWLSVLVLSFSFVVIIWHSGLLNGWNRQARQDMIAWEYGAGQYWHKAYDPYDPFTLEKSHAMLPPEWMEAVKEGDVVPVLVARATLYPEGRMQSVMLKGIDPAQSILRLPTEAFVNGGETIGALIGNRMARNNRLREGDLITVRWRDANGTFDAADIQIAGIFKTTVPAVDIAQLWIPLNRLQEMMQMPGEATLFVIGPDVEIKSNAGDWVFRDHDFLMADMKQIIRSKTIGGSTIYIILLLLALLAIFDTQVLSVFRRQREIGMHMALGMTRGQIIRLFTLEGALNGVLAAMLAAVYGIPLLSYQAVHGFELPQGIDDYGLAVTEKIFPVYSLGLIILTTLIIMLTVSVVSYLPARKILKMKTTDALRGKMQ